ncbi:MAG: cyanophycin synthetase [Rubricoccaceae bacterium]
MEILTTNVYVGPNQYARFPVIRHTIDLGILEDYPTAKLDGFVDRLLEALPGLHEHGCSYREPGGFVRRMTEDEGTWLGHVWEHVALEIQSLAGHDVTFGRTRMTNRREGEYDMVYEYKNRDVGLTGGDLARRLILEILPPDVQQQVKGDPDPDYDWEEERDAFIRAAQRKAFGPSTQSIVDAAEARDIPWIRLNPYSLVQFGHGFLQKRIQATVTGETRHIAVEIASDKEDTRNLLSAVGLPVPRQHLIYSIEGAIEAAESIGYPVVLKPLNANHGRGVSIHLTTREEVETAFGVAKQHGTSRGVLVESYISGYDHRMLVVDGRLVAVAKRVPGHVVGDGTHTIDELVEIVNDDPRRGVGHEKTLTKLQFDEQAERLMEAAGHTRETILPEGETFFLRETANLSTGGTAIDLTDVVHPDNRAMAVRAVMAVGLDVGGVDFLTDDITQSYKEVGGAIVEVNAAPGFRMHVAPSEGEPRDVAGAVMDMLFPPGTQSRLPVVVVTGTNGKTTTTRMVSHVLQLAGLVPGMTSTDGVFIDGQLTVKGDMTGPMGAKTVLRDPMVSAAVLEVARGGLVRAGMGVRQCDVAACLNVSADHLGLGRIDTLDQLAEIKRIPIEAARNTVVLNADDPRVLAMAEHTEADHVCYVTMDAEHALVREHVREGGRAVVLERGVAGEMITIFDKGRHIPLLWTHLIPATLEGKAVHNVQNAMFAAGIAYALSEDEVPLTLDQIRHGLRTFSTSFYEAPGRLNVFDEHPFKVILDYAHNPAAVKAMADMVSRMDVTGRRLIVIAAPGDRRDEDVQAVAEAAAPHFNHFVCKQDDRLRGREYGEIPGMIRDTLMASGLDASSIDVVPDEQEAIDHALHIAKPGDLLVVLGDDITRSWKQIIRFKPHGGDGQAPTEAPETTASEPPAAERLSEGETFRLHEGQTIVKDHRGVRLVMAEQDEDAD